MRKQNNQSPLISVVLPVYNGEKTIQLCVDSMLVQDFKNFELVIVNDGSRDNSLEIIKQEYSSFSNVKIFTKQNGGKLQILSPDVVFLAVFCYYSSLYFR